MRNEVTTKKLKTGQRVTIKTWDRWATISGRGHEMSHPSRSKARLWKETFPEDHCRIVRLNPITGVVSK